MTEKLFAHYRRMESMYGKRQGTINFLKALGRIVDRKMEEIQWQQQQNK